MDNTYTAVKERAFASGNVPDGLFGQRINVLFSLAGNHIVAVTPHGYFNTGHPTVIDEEEALWILKNHPHTRMWGVRNLKEIVRR